jgi:hypothetical protein
MKLFFLLIAPIWALVPICKDCKFLVNSECKKFGDVNLVTGEISYTLAKYIRADETKCGTKGVLFEKNNYKIITVPYYFVKEYWFLWSYIFIAIIYVAATYK